MRAMNKPALCIAAGLGAFAVGHYLLAAVCLPANADAPDAPPIAAVLLPSSSSSGFNGVYNVDAVNDSEYANPVAGALTLTLT